VAAACYAQQVAVAERRWRWREAGGEERERKWKGGRRAADVEECEWEWQ
jgi:hypothetical protein